MKLLKKMGVVLMVLVGISALSLAVFTYTLKPDYSGEKSLIALNEAVNVHYDTYGIPHIYANTTTDAYRSLGYVHAQDRLWQMELLRRIGRGGLSEVFGEIALNTDKFFLALGIDEASAKAVAALDEDDEAVQLSQAYLDGINQFVKSGPTPVEFYLTGLEKSEFTLHDIHNVFGYMAFTFAQAQKTDLLLTRIQDSLGTAYADDLDGASSERKGSIKNHFDPVGQTSKEHLISEVANTLSALHIPLFEGSNSWVIGPEKTTNGKVIFANDPHMSFAQPSVWYEAHIVTPNYEKYGYHLALVPFPILAHNRNLAYGMTMFENDDIDFYYEDAQPDDATKYKNDTTWVPFKTHTYSIKVKDAQAVEFTVKKTERGPVMNGILDNLQGERPISMWWTFTQNKNELLQAVYEMATATNLREMEEGLPKLRAPGLTIMYGDAEGNIAFWAGAKLYKTSDGINTKRIQSAQNTLATQREYLPFSQNPQATNPSLNYVYSANNQFDSVAGSLYPGYYLPENRAKRIIELLEPKNDWDMAAVQEMILDVTSSVNPGIVKELAKGLDLKALQSGQLALLDQLHTWKGNYPLESVEATLYHRWISFFLKYTFEDEMGSDDFALFLQTHISKGIIAPMVANPNSVWWDDVNTGIVEKQSEVIQNAFLKAYASLEQDFGRDNTKWTWDKVHTLEHGHPIGEAGGLLRSFFNVGPFPVQGSKEVINNLSFTYSDSGYFEVSVGPSTRRVIDFSDVENSMSILPTGQSGNPFSTYYQDQAEMYVKGEFRKMMMNKEEIISKSNSTLVFLPK